MRVVRRLISTRSASCKACAKNFWRRRKDTSFKLDSLRRHYPKKRILRVLFRAEWRRCEMRKIKKFVVCRNLSKNSVLLVTRPIRRKVNSSISLGTNSRKYLISSWKI